MMKNSGEKTKKSISIGEKKNYLIVFKSNNWNFENYYKIYLLYIPCFPNNVSSHSINYDNVKTNYGKKGKIIPLSRSNY